MMTAYAALVVFVVPAIAVGVLIAISSATVGAVIERRRRPRLVRPAESFTLARLEDGGVQARLVDDAGELVSWIDWDPADVRAARNALTQVLVTMKR